MSLGRRRRTGFLFGCGGAEQYHGVVDGQARKAHQVHDRHPVALNVGGERFGGFLLTVQAEGPDHPPMAECQGLFGTLNVKSTVCLSLAFTVICRVALPALG